MPIKRHLKNLAANCDICIIGAGIVGLATAYQLTERRPDLKIVVVEKEKEIAAHQTSHNSGVIHSGIYYRPGTLRAINCRKGYRYLLDFCDRYEISYEICGKVIVATSEEDRPRLDKILETGRANGLEGLIRQESDKATGVLNGIDAHVWNPQTDPYIDTQMKRSVSKYKQSNKQVLSHRFNIDLTLPVFTFIGRLVREKGADLLPDLISQVLNSGLEVAFVILGTGEPHLHEAFRGMLYHFQSRLDVALEYNEQLAHQLYAGSDFLLMPSRVEPCGLNQMYAMRYGTVPVVRSVGGLRDTVPDIGEPEQRGRGIRFDHFNLDDAHQAIWRSYELYQNKEAFDDVRQRIMNVDFSWENAAENYINIYNQLT